MRRLHAEVRRDVARRELAGDVKLGPGGIREIEFVAQALQLIRGGRDPELTARPTLDVLSLLSRKNSCRKMPRRELADAYVLPAQRRAPAAVPRRRAAPRSAGKRGRPRAHRAHDGVCFLGDILGGTGEAARRRHAALRGGVRRARAESRALARAPAPRRAAREPALRGAARGLAAAPRRADSGARRAPRRRRRTRRRRSRAASTWSRRSPAAPPTSRCSRRTRTRSSAWRASIGALELGRRVRHAPSAAARRAARRPGAVRAASTCRPSRAACARQLDDARAATPSGR